MKWEQQGKYHQASTSDYVVCAVSLGSGRRIYEAWGPAARPDLGYWDWHAVTCRAHYAQGESVPRRRERLGSAATADEARALCEQHARQAA